jgi:hypothetical protein
MGWTVRYSTLDPDLHFDPDLDTDTDLDTDQNRPTNTPYGNALHATAFLISLILTIIILAHRTVFRPSPVSRRLELLSVWVGGCVGLCFWVRVFALGFSWTLDPGSLEGGFGGQGFLLCSGGASPSCRAGLRYRATHPTSHVSCVVDRVVIWVVLGAEMCGLSSGRSSRLYRAQAQKTGERGATSEGGDVPSGRFTIPFRHVRGRRAEDKFLERRIKSSPSMKSSSVRARGRERMRSS